MNALRLRLMVVLAIGVAALATAGTASAKGDPCKAGAVDPSIDQYVESIPTGCGRAQSNDKTRTAKLPKRITQALKREAGADAALLEQIATSPTYGAPVSTASSTEARSSTRKIDRVERRHLRKQVREVRNERRDAVPEALGAIGALGGTDDGGGRLLWLVVVMGATAAAALAFALLRLRGRGQS